MGRRSRRRREREGKTINKAKVFIAIIIFVVLFCGITVFGRFVYNVAREAYFTSRQFYFTSDILTLGGAHYQFSNWDGIQEYPIEIQLYSYMNEISRLDYDLNYSISCSTTDTDKIKCTIGSTDADATTTANGVIPAATNQSRIVVFVTPLSAIGTDETVKVTVTASTTEPYRKTISCEFTLGVENQGTTTYSIQDVKNRDYATFKLTNTSNVEIEYTLEFDPRYLRLDTNDEIYIRKKRIETETINSKEYINKIVFNLEGETTRYVKFYKVDKTQNYTYPGVQETSPIEVTV